VTEWAQAAGVATVVVANPEFATPEKMGSADLVVNPSLWRADQLPGIRLPHPVDRERLPYRRRPLSGGPLRFLHVAGHRAMHDRAGTDLVVDAYRWMRNPVDLTIRTQSPLSGPTEMLMRQCPQGPPTVLRGDVEDYTTLYDGYDVLVAPRRFGGLSLPLNEAAACGLAIVATDREPERFALPPESLVPVRDTRMVRCQAGPLAVESCDATELAMRLDMLVEDRETVGRLSEASDAYATSIAWATLLPAWELLLATMPQRLATAGVA
jgi:glycosyltransferase involved in cell wall biosynthesis